MNQTPNYQLSQWEAADKVQRVDFNADNAKIDAALADKAESARVEEVAAANCLYRLIDYTVTANAASVTVSLPGGCSPEQYAALIVCAQLGTNDNKIYSGMQVNGVGEASTYEIHPISSGNTIYSACIPMGEGTNTFLTRFAMLCGRMGGDMLGGETTTNYDHYSISANSIPYRSIRSFKFCPMDPATHAPVSGQIRAGSRIRVYGLK